LFRIIQTPSQFSLSWLKFPGVSQRPTAMPGADITTGQMLAWDAALLRFLVGAPTASASSVAPGIMMGHGR
jgi:hypothetical protein